MNKFWNWILSLFGKKPANHKEPQPDTGNADGETSENSTTGTVEDNEPAEPSEPDTPDTLDTHTDCENTEPETEHLHEPDIAPGIIVTEESKVEAQDDQPSEPAALQASSKSIMLSPHFSLHELTSSATAVRYGIDNTPNGAQTANLVLLCQKVLEPIRVKYGKPVVVSSGFRCPALNRKVGGSSTSQHVSGQAADIHSVSDTLADNKALYDLIVRSGIVFDQLIYEYGNSAGPDWIHVSFSSKGNRRQKLRATKSGSKTVYTVVK